MSIYYLFHDRSRCIGCLSCQIHCKQNKGLTHPAPKPCQIFTFGPKIIQGKVKVANIFVSCFQCDNPWCVKSCPTGALYRRGEDGIVAIDRSLCIGCKSCIVACPFGAPQWDPSSHTVIKCDFCVDRLEKGLKPACVENCTTGCLYFGTMEDINTKLQELKVIEEPLTMVERS